MVRKYFAGHRVSFGLPEGATTEDVDNFIRIAKKHFELNNFRMTKHNSLPFRYITHGEDWWDKKKKTKSCCGEKK